LLFVAEINGFVTTVMNFLYREMCRISTNWAAVTLQERCSVYLVNTAIISQVSFLSI
jgi:hypothetical protein